MKLLETVSEHEMIASFLKGELNSKRFGHILSRQLIGDKREESIINSPDLTNETENQYRRFLLSYRGFGSKKSLFESFPEEVAWQRIELELEDLNKVKVMNGPKWLTYSNSTRELRQVADFYKDHPEIPEVEHVEGCLSQLRAGKSLGDIFVVGHNESDLVIIEGHVRLLSYALYSDPQLTILGIAGFSDNISSWKYF